MSEMAGASQKFSLLAGLKACLFLWAGFYAALMARTSWMFPENDLNSLWWSWNVFMAAICAALTGVFLLLPAWLLSRWLRRPQLCRILVFTIIALVVGDAVVRRYLSPPSAAAFFKARFGVDLPANAQKVRVQGPTPSGNPISYGFITTPDRTEALIKQLNLEEVPPSSDRPVDEMVSMPIPQSWPEYTNLKGRYFFRCDPKTGYGIELTCDATSTQVFMVRNLGLCKAEGD